MMRAELQSTCATNQPEKVTVELGVELISKGTFQSRHHSRKEAQCRMDLGSQIIWDGNCRSPFQTVDHPVTSFTLDIQLI